MVRAVTECFADRLADESASVRDRFSDSNAEWDMRSVCSVDCKDFWTGRTDEIGKSQRPDPGTGRERTMDGRGTVSSVGTGPTYLLVLLLYPLLLHVILLPRIVFHQPPVDILCGVELALCLVQLRLKLKLTRLSRSQPALEIVLQQQVRTSHGRRRF